MTQVALPWGQEELKLDLPDHWSLQQVAAPQLKPAPANWPERLAIALAQPVGDLSLAKMLSARRGGRVCIIVEDATRHSPLPQILPVILREFEAAGVTPQQVEVVFAAGMHQPMTEDEMLAKVGPTMAPYAMRANPWQSKKSYEQVGALNKKPVKVDRGVADADLRIIVSSVSPHLQAGFGGGYKMLFPGCADIETIRMLHRLGIGRSARQLVGTDAESNPMRRAIDQCGEMVDARRGKTFAVQYILDDNDQPSLLAAGDPLPTHRMLAKQCAAACGIVTGPPADILITNAYPRDLDLWQSFKCIANTQWAVRPNGLIICLARCHGGSQGMKIPRWPLGPAWTRRIVRLLGAEALSSLVMRLVPSLGGDAGFFVRLATQTIYRAPLMMVSPAFAGSGGSFPGMSLFGDFRQAVRAADELLGTGPQRVILFPMGGTTYPISP